MLLGMGFTNLSVEPMMIPYLATKTSATSLSQAQTIASQVCAAEDSREMRELLGLPITGVELTYIVDQSAQN